METCNIHLHITFALNYSHFFLINSLLGFHATIPRAAASTSLKYHYGTKIMVTKLLFCKQRFKIPRLASIWRCLTELNNSMLPSFFLKFERTGRDKDHGYKYSQLCRDKYFYYATGSPVLSHFSKVKLPLRYLKNCYLALLILKMLLGNISLSGSCLMVMPSSLRADDMA